jgi:hypothetical protein
MCYADPQQSERVRRVARDVPLKRLGSYGADKQIEHVSARSPRPTLTLNACSLGQETAITLGAQAVDGGREHPRCCHLTLRSRHSLAFLASPLRAILDLGRLSSAVASGLPQIGRMIATVLGIAIYIVLAWAVFAST